MNPWTKDPDSENPGGLNTAAHRLARAEAAVEDVRERNVEAQAAADLELENAKREARRALHGHQRPEGSDRRESRFADLSGEEKNRISLEMQAATVRQLEAIAGALRELDARKERDARERAAREVQRHIRGEMRAAILAVGDRRFDALIPEERKAEGVRVLAESPTDAGSGHPDGVLPPSFQEIGVAGLELLEKISEQLQALPPAKPSEPSLRVRADRWADSVPRSAEAAESSLAGDASLDRDRHSGRDQDSSSPVFDQLQAKPGWAAALQTLIDAERKGIEVFIISKPELVGSVKQLLRHDASPSVGAPDGAGAGTPTVGGGVKSSVTVPDVPPSPESGSAPVLPPPVDVARGSSEVAVDGGNGTPIQALVNLVYALRQKLERLEQFLRDGGELPAVDLVGPFGPVDDLLGFDGESGDVLGSGHDASPSVGAPDGAGVGTPTVGAEEGGASESPTDAPPTPSTTSPRAATEGEAPA